MSILKIKNTPGAWQPIASIKGEKGDTGPSGGNVTDAVKLALLRIANNVWYDEDSKSAAYVKALKDALFPPANLVSIAAVYTQSGDVYDTDELDSLKTDLVVTATMTGGTTKTIAAANYFLDGELKSGTQTITVSYGGQTTTFDVLVTRLPNGLVDGVYHAKKRDGSASEGTAIIENGAFTGADMLSYRYVYVPLQNPIKLYAGDRIVYSNAVPATGGDATYGPGPIINGDESLATRSRFYSPWLPQDGVYTMVKDAVATMIRFDTLSYFNGKTFTMSMSVNGEVVF